MLNSSLSTRFAALTALALFTFIAPVKVLAANFNAESHRVKYSGYVVEESRPSGEITEVSGDLPFHKTIRMDVTSPAHFPVPGTGTAPFHLPIDLIPILGTPLSSLSFVTMSATELVFSGPNETQSVTATVDIPDGAVAAPTAMHFQIMVKNWPGESGTHQDLVVDPFDETGNGTQLLTFQNILNAGGFLNVAINPPTAVVHKPVVTLAQPVLPPFDGVNNVTFPVSFHVSSLDRAVPNMGAVTFQIDGAFVTLHNVVIIGTFGTDFTVTADVTIDGAHAAGFHNLIAYADNGSVEGQGLDDAQVTIVVDPQAIPKPTISITTPADGSSFLGLFGIGATVEVGAHATTTYGQLNTPTAVITRLPDLVSPLAQIVFNGLLIIDGPNSAIDILTKNNLVLLPGQYQIVATATTTAGASASTNPVTFTVGYTGAPTATITSPANNSAFLANPSGAAAITFDFKGVAALLTDINNFTVFIDNQQVAVVPGVLGFPLPLPGTRVGSYAATVTGLGAHTFSVIATDIHGHPSDPATINFTLTKPAAPTAAVVAPVNASSVITDASGNYLFKFSGTAASGAQIQTLTANLDGVPMGSISLTGTGQTRTGQLNAAVSAGSHTVTVVASDSYGTLSTVASSTFTVTPTVVTVTTAIAAPTATNYSYPSGGTGASVGFNFSATANGGNVTALTAALTRNGTAVSTAGLAISLNGSSATGSGNLVLTAGTYVLSVTAQSGSVTSAPRTVSFTVTQATAPVAVTAAIAAPADCATIVFNSGSTTPVTFAFSGSATNGGNITSLTYVLKRGTTTVSTSGLTISGLNSPNATGSGQLQLSEGSYTLTVTAKSGTVTDTETNSFTVDLRQVCVTTTITKPSEGAKYSYIWGNGATIPVSFKGSATNGGNITSLTYVVKRGTTTVTSSGLTIGGLNTAAAAGSGNLILGAGTYTLTVTAKSGTISDTETNTFIVKQILPPSVDWLCTYDTAQKGGTTLSFKFELDCEECRSNDCDDDDHWYDGDCYHHHDGDCGSDDDDDYGHYGQCETDTTIKIDVREGSSTTTYSYNSGSAKYTINDGHYQFNFTTAKGKHTYTVEVYKMVDGVKRILGSKVVQTR